MRTSITRLQFNPIKKLLTATIQKEGEPCVISVIVQDIKREYARLTSYIQELETEVKHEPNDKQNHVSIVS